MINKKFADNPKKDKFIKDCTEMARSILGSAYDETTTVKTAEGIWSDYSDEDYDAKCSIFRNGLKGFSDRSFGLNRYDQQHQSDLIVVGLEGGRIVRESYDPKSESNTKTEVKELFNSKHSDAKYIRAFFLPAESNKYKEYLSELTSKSMSDRSFTDPNKWYIVTGAGVTLTTAYDTKRDAEDKIKDKVNGGNKRWNAYKVVKGGSGTTVHNYQGSDRSFSIIRDNETYYGQLIGTLLQSAVIAHLYHFQTKCRWCHADMEEYYEDIVDLLDELCEGILEPLSMDLIYANVIDQKDNPVDYFEELKAFCQDMKNQLFNSQEDSNYASIMDDIINLISKTLYRIKRFDYETSESKQMAYSKRTKKSFSKKDRWELIGDKIINGELRVNLPNNLAIPLERSILEDYTNRYENLTDQQIVDIICNDMTSGKVEWVKDYYYSKRTKKSFSGKKYVVIIYADKNPELKEYNDDEKVKLDGNIESFHVFDDKKMAENYMDKGEFCNCKRSFAFSDDLLQDFLDEYGLKEGDEFFLIAAAPDTVSDKYEVIKEKMIANQDAVDFIEYNSDDYYVAPYSVACNEFEANKLYNEYKRKYDGKKLIRNTQYSKRSFSDANGVKPAPQRFAVIFISKDHKLDCNATYKEADQDAVECFVPEGGYGLLEGKGEKFLDDLEANRMIPKCDCEAKIVPAAKVRVRGRIGHSSSSL